MLRVQERLPDERDDAHERHGVPAAPAAGEADVERNGRLDHREAAAVIAHTADLWFIGRRDHVDERAVSADDVAGRHGEDARDARRGEALELGRVHPNVIGGVDVRAEDVVRFHRSISSVVRGFCGCAGIGASTPVAVPRSMSPG